MFRIVCDPSSVNTELCLTVITVSGSHIFFVCLVGVWQRNFEPAVCVCTVRRAGTARRTSREVLWTFMRTLHEDLWIFIRTLLEDLWTFMRNLHEDLWTFMRNLHEDLWTFMRNLHDLWTFMRTLHEDLWIFLTTLHEDLWTYMKTLNEDLWTFMRLYMKTCEHLWRLYMKTCEHLWRLYMKTCEHLWGLYMKTCEYLWLYMKTCEHLWRLYMKTCEHLWYLVQFFLGWEMFRTKVCTENKNTHLCSIIFFSGNCAFSSMLRHMNSTCVVIITVHVLLLYFFTMVQFTGLSNNRISETGTRDVSSHVWYPHYESTLLNKR